MKLYWIILMAGVIVAAVWYLGKMAEHDLVKGGRYGRDLLAGKFDPDVRHRLDLKDGEEVTDQHRIKYADNMAEESKAFGTYDDFDRGVMAEIKCLRMTPIKPERPSTLELERRGLGDDHI